MPELTLHLDVFKVTAGNCTECGEELDTDRQTVGISLDGWEWMRFHQVCAWKRATFIFGELF